MVSRAVQKQPLAATDRAGREGEAAEALAAYRQSRHVEEVLRREGVLTTDEPPTTRAMRGGRPRGKRLHAEELELEVEAAHRRRLEAAGRLREATDALGEARARDVNFRLVQVLADHEVATAEVERRRSEAEGAYLSFVAAMIRFGEAQVGEAGPARRAAKLASEALVGDEAVAQLRYRAQDEIPVQLDADGSVEYRLRPSRGLFGHEAEAWVPGNDNFFAELASLVRGGRRRIGGCRSERVAARLGKTLGDERN